MPSTFNPRFQGMEQKGISDGLDVVVENLEDRLFRLGNLGGILQGLPEIAAGETLQLRVGAQVPLKRQIDAVVKAGIEAAFKVVHAPARSRAFEVLDEVPGLRFLQKLPRKA